MADPLSAAGLVLSAISLGLQLAGGVSDYIEAVTGRSEELGSIKQQATNMKDSLLTIQELLPRIETSSPPSATMIERHVRSCNAELNALYALLSELSCTVPSNFGVRLKFAKQKKKLTYPFNRSHIGRLEDRLAKVNSTLQTALQVTILNISITAEKRLREVHDVVSSISQPAEMRTRSAMACRSLTEAHEDLKITRNGIERPLEPIEAVQRLLSKPSFLSTSIESFAKYSTSPVARGSISQACLCRSSRKVSFYRREWGSFSFVYGALNTRRHLPGCPFSQIDGETQATKFTLEFSGLKKVVQKAVVLSFVYTRGAGGGSISPTLTYYPTVDESTAPAFRIVNLASDMISNSSPSSIREVECVLRCCYDNILVLYSKGKASPKDVNSKGESLIHLVAQTVVKLLRHYEDDRHLIEDAMFSAVTKLLACGVPVITHNFRGRTPCSELLFLWARENSQRVKYAKLLLPSPDVPLLLEVFGSRILEFYNAPGYLFAFLQDPLLAEASGCGPLSLAARAGDEDLVLSLIKQHPECLEEVNQFGNTPLHFAISHPGCLRLMLEAGGLSIIDVPDAFSYTPLESACKFGFKTATKILLGAGSRIILSCLDYIHESCLDDLLMSLKQRRDELKRLALENLTEKEIKSLNLDEDTVLDSNAFKVRMTLQGRRVNIPLPRDWSISVYDPWLYRTTPDIPMLDKLWAHGFRDVNSFSPNGELFLIDRIWGLEVARWFIEHGADYWTPLSERSESTRITDSVTPAHFLFDSIGQSFRHPMKSHEALETRRWLIERLLQVRDRDACSCPCSVGGCTPLKASYDCRRPLTFEPLPPQLPIVAILPPPPPQLLPPPLPIPSLRDLAWGCVNFVRMHRNGLIKEDLIATMRLETFNALELTHTCCDFSAFPYKAGRYTLEEVDEINSEQSALLTLFAELLVEFERVAYEDRGGASLILSDPEEFWIGRWLPRITEALDGLSGDDLSKEEISAAEAIGVVWGPQPTATIDLEEECHFRTPESVMSELEKIMNE
ncbi:hypothetical protein F5Y10DRAFT_284276 [Nemania abortiva]|nr:hypothetical protein F5Y10DRAFT_284276 [Nemania abortiva]